MFSGKYFNELGSYEDCQLHNTDSTYALALVHDNPYLVHDKKYVMGICIPKDCEKQSLKSFNTLISTTASQANINANYIEYLLPYYDLLDTREDLEVGYWVMVAIFILSICLGFLGMIVEYTGLGSISLNHEETNFNNIDIPIIQEGNTRDQLRQIMMIKDELLRNSKRLWASLILCFSFSRNLRNLFYKYKVHSDRLRHRNAMYLILTLGIAWYIVFSATQLGLETFPKNFQQIEDELSDVFYVIFHGGQLFGLNMIYMAIAYVVVVAMFESSTFRPTRLDLFDKKRKNSIAPAPQTNQNNQTSNNTINQQPKQQPLKLYNLNTDQKQASFSNRNNSLIDDDDIDGKYQIKRKEYRYFVRLIRRYIRFSIPILICVLAIKYIMPQSSDGPIYLVAWRRILAIPCETGWYLNLLFVQNFLYWDKVYDPKNCYPYILDGQGDQNSMSNNHYATNINESSCQHQCVPYLQMFSNLFQFLIITPLILYLHKFIRKAAYIFTVFLILASVFITFAISYVENVQSFAFFSGDYKILLMHRPWFRLSSFLTGVLLAMIVARIHILKIKVDFSLQKRVSMFLVGSGTCLTTLFILQLNNDCEGQKVGENGRQGCFTNTQAAFYNALAPMFFNAGIILIILPAITDFRISKDMSNQAIQQKMQQEIGVRMILTFDGWRVLYKMGTTVYLAHYLIIFWFYASNAQNGIIICKWVILRIAQGATIFSFFFGFLMYLLLDKPIRNIDTHVLFPTKISDSFLVKKNQRSNLNNPFMHKSGSGHQKHTGKGVTFQETKNKSKEEEQQQLQNFKKNNNITTILDHNTTMHGQLMNQNSLHQYSQQQMMMADYNDYNANNESQFSDDSEDEDTTTYRRAAIIRDTFVRSNSLMDDKGFKHTTRGDSLYGSNKYWNQNYLNSGIQSNSQYMNSNSRINNQYSSPSNQTNEGRRNLFLSQTESNINWGSAAGASGIGGAWGSSFNNNNQNLNAINKTITQSEEGSSFLSQTQHIQKNVINNRIINNNANFYQDNQDKFSYTPQTNNNNNSQQKKPRFQSKNKLGENGSSMGSSVISKDQFY